MTASEQQSPEYLRKLNQELITASLPHWALEHRTIRGKKFSFEGHWYLYDLYQDKSQDINVMKSAQCGVSEWMTTNALFLGDHGFNTVYVMPTDEVLSAYIHGRVDPAIGESDYIRKMVRGTDNIGLKQVRSAFIYFRAYLQKSPKKHKLKTIDADCMCYDEFDELGSDVRALGEKRLGHSKLAWERAVSTPTYPDMGIHREFMQTDQHEWHVKCERCRSRQTLSWPDSVRYTMSKGEVATVEVICKKCRKPLDRLSEGEWVPKHPGKVKRGYHINKLFCSMTDMKKLVKHSQSTIEYEIQEFWNSDMGLPYAPKGSKLTRGDLLSSKGNHTNELHEGLENCFMGIDIGKRHNVVILHKDRLIHACVIDDLDREGGELMERFDVANCVIDANPELHLVRAFQRKFEGRVHLAYYWPQDDKRAEFYEEKNGEAGEPDVVLVNRTALGDHLIQDQVKKRKLRMPADVEDIENFLDQMTAPTRVLARDASGNLKAKYVEYGKPDHYFHASIYAIIARFIFEGEVPITTSGSTASGKDRDTSPNVNYDTGAEVGTDARERRRQQSESGQKPNDSGIRSVKRTGSQPDW